MLFFNSTEYNYKLGQRFAAYWLTLCVNNKQSSNKFHGKTIKVCLHVVIYRVRFVFWHMKITADATIPLHLIYGRM